MAEYAAKVTCGAKVHERVSARLLWSAWTASNMNMKDLVCSHADPDSTGCMRTHLPLTPRTSCLRSSRYCNRLRWEEIEKAPRWGSPHSPYLPVRHGHALSLNPYRQLKVSLEAWKCVPFESNLQPAVQREGEGEGEVGIAAATCAHGSGQRVHAGSADAVPVADVWR